MFRLVAVREELDLCMELVKEKTAEECIRKAWNYREDGLRAEPLVEEPFEIKIQMKENGRWLTVSPHY